MNGCVVISFLTKIGIIVLVPSRAGTQLYQGIPVDFDDMVVYAKPGEAAQLSKLSENENEELRINCGKAHYQPLSSRYKISAGSSAELGQFPWAVSLNRRSTAGHNFCGGTIISKRHIVTAAHCLLIQEMLQFPCVLSTNLDDVDRIVVRYGGVCIRSYSPPCDGKLCLTAKINKIALHKGFMDSGCIGGYDIAIIEMESNFTFDVSTSAICLPTPTFDYTPLTNLLDYGYGDNEFGQFMSRLKYGRAKLIAHGAYLDMIQVGPLYKPENATIFHGICSGDSGAGLQGDYKDRTFLVGVHSLGPNICYSGTPHLLTDIRRYTGMICHITGICYHLSAFV